MQNGIRINATGEIILYNEWLQATTIIEALILKPRTQL